MCAIKDGMLDQPIDDTESGGVVNLTKEDIEELTYQKRVEEAEQGNINEDYAQGIERE